MTIVARNPGFPSSFSSLHAIEEKKSWEDNDWQWERGKVHYSTKVVHIILCVDVNRTETDYSALYTHITPSIDVESPIYIQIRQLCTYMYNHNADVHPQYDV